MDKIVKKAKKTIMFLALSTLCFFLLGILFINNAEETKKEEEKNTATHLSKIKKINQLVYVDSESEPVKFATSDDGDILSFIFDNEHIYVVRLTEDEEKDINNYFKSNTTKYNIKGNSEMFTDDIKKLIIDSYNELAEGNYLNKDNFESVFGEYYIDANSWVSDADGFEVFAIFLFFVAFITAISTLKRIKNLKKTLKSEKYNKAINEEVLANYKKVIFTENYMITLGNTLMIIDNSSLLWAYHYIFKYKFIPNHNLIYYYENKKRQSINYWFSGREVDEIIDYISNINNHALVGYSKENLEKFNNIQK